MKNEFLDTWNRSHLKHYHGVIAYDDWLEQEPFSSIISKSRGTFLDLGCGQGNDTKYLIENKKNVISCDLSNEALKILKDNFPSAKTIQADMSEKLEFEDNKFDIIISDFSLQYFSKEKTEEIINELMRIVVPSGYLVLRLSSINDKNYGALLGKKLENNYYYIEKRKKRFFDEKDIRYFFEKNWDILYLEEKHSKLERYDYERYYFEVLLRSKK